MTQYGGDYQNPYAQHTEAAAIQPPSQVSVLAIVALICAFVLPPIGFILGIVGIVMIRAKAPVLRGMGLSVSATIIGGLLSLGCGGCGYMSVQMALGMLDISNTRTQAAIQSAIDGDYDAFRAEFGSAGSGITDEQIAEFVDTLEARYGAFRRAYGETQSGTGTQRGQAVEMPMVFEFESGRRDGVIWAVYEPWSWRLDSIEIHDPDEGDLVIR